MDRFSRLLQGLALEACPATLPGLAVVLGMRLVAAPQYAEDDLRTSGHFRTPRAVAGRDVLL